MWRRFCARLTVANVISVIALFAALGGGYAVAFSGSGTVQKAKVTGIATSGYTNVRTLTGIGVLQATCDETGGDGDVSLQLMNSSGQTLRSWTEFGEDGFVNDTVTNNQASEPDYEASPFDTIRYHIHPASADDKRPQAELTVSVFEAAEPDCSDSEVTVLALNTEE